MDSTGRTTCYRPEEKEWERRVRGHTLLALGGAERVYSRLIAVHLITVIARQDSLSFVSTLL